MPESTIASTDTPEVTTGPAPIVAAPVRPLVTPISLPPLPAGDPLPDDLVARYMSDEIGRQPELIEEATNTILESGDTRFIAVFLELIRAGSDGSESSPVQGSALLSPSV